MNGQQKPGSYFVKGTPTLDAVVQAAESRDADQIEWRVAGFRAPGYERQLKGDDGKIYNLRFFSLIIRQSALTITNIDDAYRGPGNEFLQAGIPLSELQNNKHSQTTFPDSQRQRVRGNEFLLLGFALTLSTNKQQHAADTFDYVGIQPFIKEQEVQLPIGRRITIKSWWSRALARGHAEAVEDSGWHNLYFTTEARGHTLRLRYADTDSDGIQFIWTVD